MKNIINEIKNIINNSMKISFPDIDKVDFNIEKTKNISFGNYSTNISLVLSKILKDSPINIGQKIISVINSDLFEKIEIVKPGFINFFFSDKMSTDILTEVISEKENYGQYPLNGKYINIEYVSANPTGNLHIGHARNAALGSTLGTVMKKYGYVVDSEYYVNDAGMQIDILGVTVLIRYLELFGIENELNPDFYHGKEPKIVAEYLKKEYGDNFIDAKFEGTNILDKHFKNTINTFSKYFLLENIKKTLELFRCNFDIYYKESTVYLENLIPKYLKELIHDTYISSGALWLDTTKYQDDKDRVIVKSDGKLTYFTPDIVYHAIKLSRRKYHKVIDIFGADHGSYINRLKAAISSLGNKDVLDVIVMQMIRLTKDGEAYKMSKRKGIGITMLELINAIGVEYARWYLVSQTANSHLEIEIEKCLKKDNTNQLYYVLYAFARISKIIRKTSKFNIDKINSVVKLHNVKEKEIIDHISFFPILIKNVAEMYEVQKINTYLYELANLFHSYYSNVKIIDDSNIILQNNRLYLIHAIKWVLYSGLKLLEIEPKEEI